MPPRPLRISRGTGAYLGEWRRRLALRCGQAGPLFPWCSSGACSSAARDDVAKLIEKGELGRSGSEAVKPPRRLRRHPPQGRRG